LSDTVALCYHGVSRTWLDPMAVTPEQLQQQVGWFLRRGYRPVTVRQAVSEPAQGGRRLVITFDDALLSVHSLARPVLEQLGAVATVYAPSVPIAAGEPMSWPEVAHHLQTKDAHELAPMSPAQLREVADNGWEVGSHTRTHPWLPKISADQLGDELNGSKNELEQLLHRPIETLAYPFGAYDERVATATAAAGYVAAVTLPVRVPAWPRKPSTEELMALPRIGIYRVDEWRRFRVKVARPVRRLRAGPLWGLTGRG
jgi:peptidoglycan/xylan/chitin deacetylase (PgdA/CDA1 family)